MLNIPLMSNNIQPEDIAALTDFLQTSDRFTNGPKVQEFERAWSEWLGVKHTVFVNSGASANFITMAVLRDLYGTPGGGGGGRLSSLRLPGAVTFPLCSQPDTRRSLRM